MIHFQEIHNNGYTLIAIDYQGNTWELIEDLSGELDEEGQEIYFSGWRCEDGRLIKDTKASYIEGI